MVSERIVLFRLTDVGGVELPRRRGRRGWVVGAGFSKGVNSRGRFVTMHSIRPSVTSAIAG